jgi:excisionase family DNA binding protein
MQVNRTARDSTKEDGDIMSALSTGLSELVGKLEKMAASHDRPVEPVKAVVLDEKWNGRHTFSVPEAAEILGVSRWTAYGAVKSGQLAVIWIGRRCLVPRLALERLLGGGR